jgi:ABC-type glycerol-3-phosphate transport system substrate-binding protein
MQNNVNFNSIGTSQKALEDAVNYYTDFENLYHIWDSVLPSSTNQFANGKVGIYFGPSWRVFDIKKINPNLKFSLHPIPQLPLDPLRKEQPITWASYWAEAVNTKSTHSKEAWDFIKFISNKENLPKFHQASIASGREFGEPYSRQDLADQIKNNSYMGAIVEQAPYARSWYLSSFTHDGPSGINTKLSTLFTDYLKRKKDTNAFATELNQVLSEYGLATAVPVSK